MAWIYYNSSLIRPVPSVTISQNKIKNGAGETIGNTYSITVNIILMSFKGSPRSDGTFWTISNDPPDEDIDVDDKIAAISRKQEAIRDLFATEGQLFEIQSRGGGQPIKFNPRILSISFNEGLWVETCSCTIQMEADKLYLGDGDEFDNYLNNSEESWQLDTDETPENINSPRTYRLSHTVSATGRRHYDDSGALTKEAWQAARDDVVSKLGFDSSILLSSGVSNLPSYYGGFNHVRNENIDKSNGSYSVTETWLIASGTALEDFTVNTSRGNDGLINVTVNGNITGLEQRDANLGLSVSKWDNALSKFNTIQPLIKNRAETYSSASLHATPTSYSTARNPAAGTISYDYGYNSRFRNLVTGTLSEVISVQNNLETDLFATIGIIGRTLGNLLQDLNTRRELQRTVNIELVFDSDYIPSGASISEVINNYNPRLHSPQSTEIASILSAAHPVTAGLLNNNGNPVTKSYISDQSENWNFSSRSYSRNITYVYE
jgi:hypothetical protein